MQRLILPFLCLILAIPCQAGIIYVDANTPDNNDGSSWAKAYKYLQDALADANSDPNVDEIRVAQGIYTPDSNSSDPNGSGERAATFQLINGLALKGGYGGPDPNSRNIGLYETILSGDLESNDAGFANNGENSYHVVTGSGTDVNALLDGFTITSGNANTLTNKYGGGMGNDAGSPTVVNCSFIENMALYGGGMSNRNGSDPKLTNCVFKGNRNSWISEDGGVGGGMYNNNSSPELTNCTFTENWSEFAAGMYNSVSSAVLTNCTFSRNSVDWDGGGMFNKFGSPTLTNCTFTENSADYGVAGAVYNFQGNPGFKNCILWGNTPQAVYVETGSPKLNYCDIEGGWSGSGGNNINMDPNFADPNNDDYHLKSQAGRWSLNAQSWVQDNVTSPCIDAGDPSSSIGWEPIPNGGRINMGAYGGTGEASKSYFGAPVCQEPIAGDINGDCKVNFFDLAIMGLHWLEDNTE